MKNIKNEIAALEEQLRLAELGPDPHYFEQHLADDAVMVSDGGGQFAKSQIVAAHQPGAKPPFARVEMSDLKIIDHGVAAVVTCNGVYENSQTSFALKFMRVWVKTSAGWKIVAGSVSK